MFYLCQSSWDQFSWNSSTLLAVLHAQTMLGRISSLVLIYSADGELLSIFLQSFEGVFLDDRVSFHLSSFLSPALLWGLWFLLYECEPWVCIHHDLLSKPEDRDQNTEMYNGLRQFGGDAHLRHLYLFRPWRGHRKRWVALVLTDAESETQRSQDTCLRSYNCMVVVLKIGIRSFVLGLRCHLCNHRLSQNWGLATPKECWGRVHVINSVQ